MKTRARPSGLTAKTENRTAIATILIAAAAASDRASAAAAHVIARPLQCNKITNNRKLNLRYFLQNI